LFVVSASTTDGVTAMVTEVLSASEVTTLSTEVVFSPAAMQKLRKSGLDRNHN